MSHITLDEMAPLLSREATKRAGSLLWIFVVVSLAFLVAAAMWQKKYTSLVQIYVDDKRIVEPIAGARSATDRDQANLAEEELFSAEILNRIIVDAGHVEQGMNAIERERLKEEIIGDTDIHNINNQLIEIRFEHTDPRMAFETSSLYADLFLEKSMRSSTEETTDAFEFIIDQVETYRNKLEDAEGRLESFRSQYPGVSTTTGGNVEQRIIELRRQREETQLLFGAADQKRKSLSRELSSETSTIARDYAVSQTQEQVSRLQAEIDVLMLSYTEDYPDIVRRKQQINDLIQSANSRSEQGASTSGTANFTLGGQNYTGAANLSPVYQQLRSDLARATAEADSLRSRAQQLSVLLEKEINRSSVSSKVERELGELTRDYKINKDIYEDLLKRQESARLSMSLGAEKQGVLYRIHQPANFPVLPTGLRFSHIAGAGLLFGALLPFLYLVVFLKLDPRIRTASTVTDVLELPLLTTVPHMKQPGEKATLFSRPWMIVSVVMFVVALYIMVALYKFMASTQGVSIG